MEEIAAMQACAQPELPYLGTSGIILAGEDIDPNPNLMININQSTLSLGKNGSLDTSTSESTSHGSQDVNQGMVEHLLVFPVSTLPQKICNFMSDNLYMT